MKSYYQKTEQKKNQNKTQTEYFKLFKGKDFWIPDKVQHEIEYDKTNGKCCFWHIIGLPEKEGRGKLPLFDYEWDLYQDIERDKYVWVLKSAGLGLSTFMLYYIKYKAITDPVWKGKSVVVITGPRIDLSIMLIKRLKSLFPLGVLPDDKETVATINGVRVEAFPSHNLDSARGQEKPILIWLDEADFFPLSQQEEARVISERYIGKSPGLAIVMTSTANAPEGLYESIQRLPQDQCLYTRRTLDYTVGLGKIYTEQEIAKARESPSFGREYECQFLGQIGNLFSHESIEKAIQNEALLKEQIHPDLRDEQFLTPSAPKSMGIDGAFGGDSKFAITVCEDVPANGNIHPSMIEVKHTEEHSRPDFDTMIAHIIEMKKEWNITKIYVDAANPEIIRALKKQLGERTDYERLIDKIKLTRKQHIGDDLIKYLKKWMDVIPVSFNQEGRSALARCKIMLDRGWLALDDKNFHELVISLRTAVSSDTFLLDKTLTSHDDLLDSFRLSLLFWDV